MAGQGFCSQDHWPFSHTLERVHRIIAVVESDYALLDEVGCTVIGDFQKFQCYLMFKSSIWDQIWSKKEGVSGIEHFYWVPLYGTIMFLFIHQILATPIGIALTQNLISRIFKIWSFIQLHLPVRTSHPQFLARLVIFLAVHTGAGFKLRNKLWQINYANKWQ